MELVVKPLDQLKAELKKQSKECQEYWQELAKALCDTEHLGQAPGAIFSVLVT